MVADLSMPKFEWDHPSMHQAANAAIEKQVILVSVLFTDPSCHQLAHRALQLR